MEKLFGDGVTLAWQGASPRNVYKITLFLRYLYQFGELLPDRHSGGAGSASHSDSLSVITYTPNRGIRILSGFKGATRPHVVPLAEGIHLFPLHLNTVATIRGHSTRG